MKSRTYLSFALAAFLCACLVPGCRLGTGLSHDPLIYNTNSPVRAWYPGLMMTFPNTPTDAAAALLANAAARKVSEKIFTIEKYNRRDENQGNAIHQALVEGATMTGWRVSP